MSGIFQFSLYATGNYSISAPPFWLLDSEGKALSSFENFQTYMQDYLEVSERFTLILQESNGEAEMLVVTQENEFQEMKRQAQARFKINSRKAVKVQVRIAGFHYDDSVPVFDFLWQTVQDATVHGYWSLHRSSLEMSSFQALQSYLQAETKTNRSYDLLVPMKNQSSTLLVEDETGFLKMLALKVQECAVYVPRRCRVLVIARSTASLVSDCCALCDELVPETNAGREQHYEKCRNHWIRTIQEDKEKKIDPYFVPAARVIVTTEYDHKQVKEEGFIVSKSPKDTFCVQLRKGKLLGSVLRKYLTRETRDICRFCESALSPELSLSSHYEYCRSRVIQRWLLVDKVFKVEDADGFQVGARVVGKISGEEGFIVSTAHDDDYDALVVQLSNGAWLENVTKDEFRLAEKVKEIERCAYCSTAYSKALCEVCKNSKKLVCEMPGCHKLHYEDCRQACIAANAGIGQIQAAHFRIGSGIWVQDQTRDCEYVSGFIVAYDEALAQFSIKYRDGTPTLHTKIDAKDVRTADFHPVKEVFESSLVCGPRRVLTNLAIEVFKRIFAQFSAEGIVQYLDNEVVVRKRARFMNLEQFSTFVAKSSQKQEDPVRLLKVFYYRSASAVSAFNQAALLESDFVRNYAELAACAETEHIVWFTLFEFGYDAHLNPVPKDQLLCSGELVEYYNEFNSVDAIVINILAGSAVEILLIKQNNTLMTCSRENIRKDYTICRKCQKPLRRVSLHSFTCCDLCESHRPDFTPVEYINIRP